MLFCLSFQAATYLGVYVPLVICTVLVILVLLWDFGVNAWRVGKQALRDWAVRDYEFEAVLWLAYDALLLGFTFLVLLIRMAKWSESSHLEIEVPPPHGTTPTPVALNCML